MDPTLTAYRNFCARFQKRMAARQPKPDDWMNEPPIGPEKPLGLLGLPLPDPGPDLFETIIDLLECAPHAPLWPETEELARAGRGGDTLIAHLTPGEIVLPRRMQTPEVMAALARAGKQAGIAMNTLTAGSRANRINPATGAPEFDETDESATDATDGAASSPGFDGSGFEAYPAEDSDVDSQPYSSQPFDVSSPDSVGASADVNTDTASTETPPSQGAPAYPPGIDPNEPNAAEIKRRARVVYGETSSIRPALLDPARSADNPSNWDPDSAKQLAEARKNIAFVSARNPVTRPDEPSDYKNPIQAREWASSIAAARESMADNLDGRVNSFMMRQEPYKPARTGYINSFPPMGPFYNIGGSSARVIAQGRAIEKGPRAYIDFFDNHAK